MSKWPIRAWAYSWTGSWMMNFSLIMYLFLVIGKTVKLVKISLAMFYSSLKHKKQFDDHERIQAQKRAEIINFIISLIERANNELN